MFKLALGIVIGVYIAGAYPDTGVSIMEYIHAGIAHVVAFVDWLVYAQ